MCNLYREWKYLYQNKDDDQSDTLFEQSKRWDSFLQQIETAVQSGKEIHILGDTNLNFFEFEKIDTAPANSHTGRLASLIKGFRDKIIHHGFFQLIKDPTHTWQGRTESLLDHYWTN